MRKLKVAFFHNQCSPYRIPLFRKISELPYLDLTVYFGKYRSLERKWTTRKGYLFRYRILKHIRGLDLLFGSYNPINPSLFLRLVLGKYDVYIGGVPYYIGTIVTFLVAKMLRRPFVLFVEDVDIPARPYKSRLDGFLALPLKKRVGEFVFFLVINTCSRALLRYSDAYVVPGFATKNYLLRRNVNASKIHTAVNAVDNDAMERECKASLKKGRVERLKAKWGLENKKVILAVAYLSERKGLQYLIPACAKLKKEMNDIALVIVGEGSYEKTLRKLSVRNDIETIFAGYVLDLVDYYLMADVFVLPTLDDVWGFVINEAMVCGCPVITTKNAGSSLDLVKDGINGYVVEAGSTFQLYQALRKILESPMNAKLMGEKSRDIVRDYCYEKSVKGFESAIAYVARASQ